MRCPLTRSAGNALSVVSWVMGTANRMKGRAVVILSVGATHLLMASEDSDMVGMKTCEKGPKVGSECLPTSKTSQCVRTACTAFPRCGLAWL